MNVRQDDLSGLENHFHGRLGSGRGRVWYRGSLVAFGVPVEKERNRIRRVLLARNSHQEAAVGGNIMGKKRLDRRDELIRV